MTVRASSKDPSYESLPPAARERLAGESRESPMAAMLAELAAAPAPDPILNSEGETESHRGVIFTHHFSEAPADGESITWHWVEAGAGEPVVFLHGIPDSWRMWIEQMAALAGRFRVIGIDLRSYGQSDRRTGDHRQEGVAQQLGALLDVIGVSRFNLVTHDRGSVIADYLGANEPHRIIRYIRGQQHFYYFTPELAPQEKLFTNKDTRNYLDDARQIVTGAYGRLCGKPVTREHLVATLREWNRPGIGPAVERYFQSSSFRKEWLDRRRRLIAAWRFPVLVLQGALDPRQPREFYGIAPDVLPDGEVRFIDAGHFFPAEAPEETTRAIREFLERSLR